MLQILKGTFGPRHDLGFALCREPFLPHVHPHEVSGLKLDSLLVFVDSLHDLGVHLLNPFPHLSMEFLDLFRPLFGLPTKLSRSGK